MKRRKPIYKKRSVFINRIATRGYSLSTRLSKYTGRLPNIGGEWPV